VKLIHLRNSKTAKPWAQSLKDGGGNSNPVVNCMDGPRCPNVYRTDRDTFIIQGWVITDAKTLEDLDIPPGESAVEIPLDLIPELAKESVSYA
jgi:hypothetical protein